MGRYFLAATQDIAVDGWAITMLSKKNVGYAGSTPERILFSSYVLRHDQLGRADRWILPILFWLPGFREVGIRHS